MSVPILQSVSLPTFRTVIFVNEETATIGGGGRKNGTGQTGVALCRTDAFQGLAEGF